MIFCATFVLYYLTNTVERKTINKLNTTQPKRRLAKPTNNTRQKQALAMEKQIKQLTL